MVAGLSAAAGFLESLCRAAAGARAGKGEGAEAGGAARPGRGKGSERLHKMAAAPGAGPPDPGVSVLLSCLQVAMATGQVLFHRFFYSKSFVKHSFEVREAEADEKGFLHPEAGRKG